MTWEGSCKVFLMALDVWQGYRSIWYMLQLRGMRVPHIAEQEILWEIDHIRWRIGFRKYNNPHFPQFETKQQSTSRTAFFIVKGKSLEASVNMPNSRACVFQSLCSLNDGGATQQYSKVLVSVTNLNHFMIVRSVVNKIDIWALS